MSEIRGAEHGIRAIFTNVAAITHARTHISATHKIYWLPARVDYARTPPPNEANNGGGKKCPTTDISSLYFV